EPQGELREGVGYSDVDVGGLPALLGGVHLDAQEPRAAARGLVPARLRRSRGRHERGRRWRLYGVGLVPRWRHRQRLRRGRAQGLQQRRGLLDVDLARSEHVEDALALVGASHSAPPRQADVEVAGRHAQVEPRRSAAEHTGERAAQPRAVALETGDARVDVAYGHAPRYD